MRDSAETNPRLMLVVAAALVRGDGRILVQQRPPGKQHAGLWEFPGGKIEPGEHPEAALVRELAEELGIDVDPVDFVPLMFASEALGERHLVLLLYRVMRWKGEPRAIEATELRWVTITELRMLPMPPADAPFVEILAHGFSEADAVVGQPAKTT
ncbi:(deoxy)nucleoside triphosphate pyrophosphohydrolase [Sphingomonas radiodurans]|uniref:(deoxy)nucleoside triphosphate pyrophosphohydrolase n=1 Tax=Sphingomonas radiodurans TaxID=2890321 RepID=UPI001E41C856|nr:(deoxy)nucleoside triphosphate pyrophosphohydrolase [Sphingomonas radiodurans]WBH17611.1 (deoxy)nucleoside triphosphate pyrophosphohydrolase [Sphingomonas radiodurans]